ncbi:MAG: carbon-nitrogen hydrolase family protein [Chloroflexi bacterium]|nr:carbon-nitrogen hydrolase family protein [Chloroflexota bacterium]
MKEMVNVALFQTDVEPLNVQANLEKIEARVAGIMDSPVDLVVFPALANSGHPGDASKSSFAMAAEPVDGAFVTGLREIARRYKVHLVAGFLEQNPSNCRRPFNSAALVDPRGGLVGIQRQVHAVGEDRGVFSRGDNIGVFPTELGNIALVVGTDLEYPEFLRVQTLRGAEIGCCLLGVSRQVADPAGWLALIGICRAMEDKVYALLCNRVGHRGSEAFWGASCIVDPAGGIVAQAALSAEDVVRAEMSRDFFVEERFAKPNFRDRRPENYGLICKKRRA